jgi:SHS2 domain-containing protein
MKKQKVMRMAKKKSNDNGPEVVSDAVPVEEKADVQETAPVKTPFQVMTDLLNEVWQQYWKVREVTNHNDPFQKKRALEFEQNYREAKRAMFDLENAQK